MTQQIRQKKPMTFILTALALIIIAIFGATSVHADTTQPTIVSVSPTNNEQNATLLEQINVTFSEDMNPSTLNENTFMVEQRTTPLTGEILTSPVEGTIHYSESERTATFTPTEKLDPNQHYGNVFTATITSGVEDLAGNSIERDYVWSFTTGQDRYNTGTSTSQSDQSVAAGTVPPIQTTAPQYENDSNTANESNTALGAGIMGSTPLWMWILSGILLLVLIALLVLAFSTKKSDKVVTNTRNNNRIVRSSPFGDVHDVTDLEGIGPIYGRKLHEMGIEDTKQLWEASASKVSNKTGAPLSTVIGWQHMAELASIRDIGPQYAELLERSGVHSIDQLKDYKTDDLLKLVRKKQNSLNVNIQGNTPGTALVENWIEQANNHNYSERKGQRA